MATLGEVLAAVGSVAGSVHRATRCVAEAQTTLGTAASLLADALAGHDDTKAGDALTGMAVARGRTDEVDELLDGIAAKLSDFVERLRKLDGTSVPPGTRAARAPVAGRAHPTHLPTPPVDQRDYEWAAQVRAQLTEWKEGGSTEALVFDTDGQDWQVNSGVDAELTVAARVVIKKMIADGEVGTSADAATNHSERTWLGSTSGPRGDEGGGLGGGEQQAIRGRGHQPRCRVW